MLAKVAPVLKTCKKHLGTPTKKHLGRRSTWGHPQPEVILPSLTPLVFERFLPILTLWLSPNSSPGHAREPFALASGINRVPLDLAPGTNKPVSRDTHRPEASPPSLTLLVFERFLPSLTLWLSPNCCFD